MRSRWLASAVAVAAVAFVFVTWVLAVPARACSVCQAGDPLFSSNGSTAQEQGTISGYLEVMGWRKTSGLLPEEPGEEAEPGREVNESQQLTLFLGWTPLDRLTLTLALPWRFNDIDEQPEGEESVRSRLNGFSDLSLHVGYVLWRDRDVLPSTWVELRGFGKAPTGESSQERGRRSVTRISSSGRVLGFWLRTGGRASPRVGIALCERAVS